METRGGVGKSGMLEHKSDNISETRKHGGKVTMEQCYVRSENKVYFNSYFSSFWCNNFSSNANFSYKIIPKF